MMSGDCCGAIEHVQIVQILPSIAPGDVGRLQVRDIIRQVQVTRSRRRAGDSRLIPPKMVWSTPGMWEDVN